ncbi:MAG: hypothetical protein IJK31_09265 [Ruminococcus sp.]|nr:hypothetical protein [Ruminococcus sp.]HRR75926.1 hypothetical protein [Ruminococcus sp.]
MKKLISAIAAIVLTAGGTGITGVLAEEAAHSIVYGDADCDGFVKMNDVVLIMQCISNPDQYSLTVPGKANADVQDRCGGITPADALAIQRYLLKQGELPDRYTEMNEEQTESAFSAYLCNWLNYYRQTKGKDALDFIPEGDTYGGIRAAQLAESFESAGSDRDMMNSAVETSFSGGFYDSYDLYSEIKGRPFLTETDINEGEPVVNYLDIEEIARSSAEQIVENENLWGLIGSDIVAGIGAGAKVSDDGRIYFTIFVAGTQQ